MTRPIRLDLSRLFGRIRHSTASGIDRVELAYARHFLAHPERAVRFVSRAGPVAREFPSHAVDRFLDRLETDWHDGGPRAGVAAFTGLYATSRRASTPGRAISIIPSHQNWHRTAWLRNLRGADGRLVLFLHDLIPFDYPEYARQGGAERHRQRLEAGLEVADAFMTNSRATRDAFERFCGSDDVGKPVIAAPIGTLVHSLASPSPASRTPYFVALGTIEPRKNHLLLLHVWRSLAEAGCMVPELHIVGRRGWENENILDLLDRSRSLADHIVEHPALCDRDLARLLGGARALLMPSFVEGFGMPVCEALAMGLPVIAADLPVYRETAGHIPEYLDPLDGPGWTRAILDYADSNSLARQAQIERICNWSAPDWQQHFDALEDLLKRLDR